MAGLPSEGRRLPGGFVLHIGGDLGWVMKWRTGNRRWLASRAELPARFLISAPEEGEKIGVADLRMRLGHTVRQAFICLQRSGLQQVDSLGSITRKGTI